MIIAYHDSKYFAQLANTEPEGYESFLEELCRHSKLMCLNLDPALLRSSTAGGSFRDGHWNDSGHVAVAEALAEYIGRVVRDEETRLQYSASLR